jgi:hypothetical protein
MRITRVVLTAACGLAMLTGCAQKASKENFADATKIVLTQEVFSPVRATKIVTVSDPKEVAEFVAAIRLVEKDPCACAHLESAAFTTPTREIYVSLCDHCFDFGGKNYKMPAGFYALFQARFPK